MLSKHFRRHIYKVTSGKKIRPITLLIALIVTLTLYGKSFLLLSGKMVGALNKSICIISTNLIHLDHGECVSCGANNYEERPLLYSSASNMSPQYLIVSSHNTVNNQRNFTSSKIVFAAIVRDNIKHLPGLIERLAAYGKLFKEFSFVFSENDSSDGTKEYLDQLHHNAPFSVTRVGQDFHLAKRPSIGFLAQMRNFYLYEIYTQPIYADYDYVVVFDADFEKDLFVTREGLLDSFNRTEDWAVMAANGERSGKMFDAFAFRNEEFDLPYNPGNFPNGIHSYWPTILHIQKKYEDGPLIPVNSAFGGLAIYKASVLRGLLHETSSEDCEHVSLHRQIKARGGKIYMNPNMRLIYTEWV